MTLGPDPSPAWNPVTPVISTTVSVIADSRSSISVSGRTVRLIVTFVEQDSAGVRSVVGVTGFTSADVAVVAVAPDGAEMPVAVTVAPAATIAYELTAVPVVELWNQELLTGCSVVTLTLNVPAGTAVTVNGDPTEASDTMTVTWMPGNAEGDCQGNTNSKTGKVHSHLIHASRTLGVCVVHAVAFVFLPHYLNLWRLCRDTARQSSQHFLWQDSPLC